MSHLRKRLDDYIHDIVLVSLPLMICLVGGCISYIILLSRIEKMRVSPLLRESLEAQILWSIVGLSALFCTLLGGRLTAFIWRKEEEHNFNPPPCRIYRGCNLVFCWSDNLTTLFTAPFRWISLPFIALGRLTAGFLVRLNRKRRRLRIRLLWLAHAARSKVDAMHATAVAARRSRTQAQPAQPAPQTPVMPPLEAVVPPLMPIASAPPEHQEEDEPHPLFNASILSALHEYAAAQRQITEHLRGIRCMSA